ncbi:MAG: bifunctional [glutamate--ammonia ligase]-adenylyl-L-tyrosine phosphorylase/[glutamate--ammonia-ligase] adenylyltransferase [Deltaproteobacteria bacterium]|nr:bifunctional [glutamate--ammonia ligase]-adenylyl-L-tyrosine phosphorylase/[glutamate--ammonia-ligase] adenylyltransferase [Deltaproteobacteria bacterium]
MEILKGLTEKETQDKLLRLGFTDPGAALVNLKLLAATPFKDCLDELTRLSIQSPSPDACLNNLERAAKKIPWESIKESLKDPATLPWLVRLLGSSNYLANILCQNPALYGYLFVDAGITVSKDFETFRDELKVSLDDITEVNDAMRTLRVYRHKEYLRIGGRDLLGLSGVVATTAELSNLASACLDAAVEFSSRHLKNAYGAPVYINEAGDVSEAVFTVIALGKLGGNELNFSSDIDIIYVYSWDLGETTGRAGKPGSKISPYAFFIKLSAMVNRLIGGVTEDGFVFRVDLDLRPEGRSGALCGSLRSMEIYYESWGQMWERAAFIKARPVGGSKALGEEFLTMIRPFIYKRYLDFTAIEEIKAMKEKIDLALLRKDPEAIDVKLGAGGIREIEFFCQALQLIHGGKDPDLREKNTLCAIERLREKGFLNEKDAAALHDGYIFLRNLEHRIQMVEGLQTQAIPATKGALERLARMMGFKDAQGGLYPPEKTAGAAFRIEFNEKTAAVHEVYRSLFYKGDEKPDGSSEDVRALLSPDATKEETAEKLKTLGFKDPEAAYGNLVLLMGAPTRVRLGARGRVVVEKLLPLFISSAIKAPDPDMALGHLERFTCSVGVRTAFYSLLLENRLIIEELMKLLGTSVFLSRLLIERPESLETLLSKELSIPYKRRAEFLTELDCSANYEDSLDALRRIKNQEVFRIGVNDLRGVLLPRQVSVQITFLACAALDAALKIASRELEKRFGAPNNAAICIIGMGRLGGGDLIYGSDLDVVFVYDGEADLSTKGGRRITNHEFFVKLGARIISVLTLKTKDGSVFTIDARLRPSGSSGPLVVSRAALLKYHRGKTSVWERQAWLKAKPVAGDIRAGEEILSELDAVIFNHSPTDEDVRELLRIRKRMETEIAKEDATRFNIKTGAGGMVDVEFLIQALQLENFEDKTLRTPSTLKAIKRLIKKGIVSKEDGTFLKEAYGFYRLIELRQRVVHDRPEGYLYKGTPEGEMPLSTETLAKRCGCGGEDAGASLLADYERYAKKVRALYMRTLEAIREIKTLNQNP